MTMPGSCGAASPVRLPSLRPPPNLRAASAIFPCSSAARCRGGGFVPGWVREAKEPPAVARLNSRFLMAVSTAAGPLTPFLHGRHPRNRRRASVAVVNATAGGAEETSAASAAAGQEQGQAKKKTVDTRIHWSDPDEGWVGGKAKKDGGEGSRGKNEPLGGRFADLINAASESHYEFMGIAPKADIEEIKAAYRRLSKEYHPDTTTLPLKAASEKFIRLREVYNVLSKEESRRFYDWTLAQEVESRRLQRLRSRLEDPYEQDLQNYESVPDMVDRLGGRNMKLSDQAITALGIDIIIIIFSFCCIIYAVFFKEQY